jgi:hypothetical protein
VFHTSMARRRSSTYTHTGPLYIHIQFNAVKRVRTGIGTGTGTGFDLLGKGARFLPKEFKKSVGISVHVEFHLSLFQNLKEIIVESTCANGEWLMTSVVPRTWLR